MGRRRVTLSDGRRVIGYRKTLAQRAPRRAVPWHLLPWWNLSFELPGMSSVGVVVHPMIGVTVRDGHVEVAGKNKDWVLDQAVCFLRTVMPQGLPSVINVRLQRDTETPPSLSGPSRPGVDTVTQIYFDGDKAHVGSPTSMRVLGSAA